MSVYKRQCALCKTDPATGFATIGDDRYCHGDADPSPTCYEVAQWRLSDRAARDLDAIRQLLTVGRAATEDRTRGCPCRTENGGSGMCGCILGGPAVTC